MSELFFELIRRSFNLLLKEERITKALLQCFWATLCLLFVDYRISDAILWQELLLFYPSLELHQNGLHDLP